MAVIRNIVKGKKYYGRLMCEIMNTGSAAAIQSPPNARAGEKTVKSYSNHFIVVLKCTRTQVFCSA